MSRSTYLSSLVLAGALLGCNEETAPARADVAAKYLISADSVNSIPLSTLRTFAGMAGQPSIAGLVRHGVTTYRLVYQTTYKGKLVRASGLLYVPQELREPAPIISLQHGTTFEKDGAPSVAGDYTGMEFFAAAGYIALMPDYLGFGESADIFHPYYDQNYSAHAVIDLIKSAREFLERGNVAFNEKLFLAGYSEGGYVTLAAAKELDTDRSHNLQVTAVAAGAGGYDLNAMLHSVTTGTHYSYPAYLAYVLLAYNATYNWNRPLTYFFQDKYAAALDTSMNGEYSGWQINSRLTTHVPSLLNSDFLGSIRTSTGEPALKSALASNTVAGWKTSLPVRLYHGTRDEIIPFYADTDQSGQRRLEPLDPKLLWRPA